MVTCPWCGTQYLGFTSSCKKCGGPIPNQEEPARQAATDSRPVYPPPPAVPRPVSPNFAWKLMQTDEKSIIGLVFTIIGGTFFSVGFGLTVPLITAFVGLPFALLGLAGLGAGVFLLYQQYQDKQAIVNVLIWGECVTGQITDVRENLMLTINNRHPWVIEYQYMVNGQSFTGSVSTLQPPFARFVPQQPVYVLYQASDPARNALYPHP